jgi:hypothetical protein
MRSSPVKLLVVCTAVGGYGKPVAGLIPVGTGGALAARIPPTTAVPMLPRNVPMLASVLGPLEPDKSTPPVTDTPLGIELRLGEVEGTPMSRDGVSVRGSPERSKGKLDILPPYAAYSGPLGRYSSISCSVLSRALARPATVPRTSKVAPAPT